MANHQTTGVEYSEDLSNTCPTKAKDCQEKQQQQRNNNILKLFFYLL